MVTLRVLGCRGSASVSGDPYRRYGGNTTCFHAEVEPGHHLVVDCGSGLRTLDQEVAAREPQTFTILLTHYHWDHIQGLPVFMPLFEGGNRISFYGPRRGDRRVDEILGSVIRPPWWPIDLGQVAATVSFRDLNGPVDAGPVTVRHTLGKHPQGVVVYRLDGPARSVAIVTDHEAGDDDADESVRRLAEGADVLIHDAQYTPEELGESRAGWGHSSYDRAVAAARAAGVGRLILTSHDPNRSDEGVDRLRATARAEFPNTDAAYEGMKIEF